MWVWFQKYVLFYPISLSLSIKSKDTQAPVVDTTVWDPPLEGLLGESEPAPTSLGQETPEQDQDPQEIQPYLMLPTNLKDLRVRLTHVVSPGSFYVQLLQMDTQLKRSASGDGEEGKERQTMAY